MDRTTGRLVGLLGCRHHPDEPHRPYCEVTLDLADTDRDPYRPQPRATELDRFDPDGREPAGGNQYWADTEDIHR